VELSRRCCLCVRGHVAPLLDDPNMFGYCYTQLTDLMQERNGIYRFDRSTKLDVETVRKAQLRPAACENSDDRSGTIPG
jgi:hypothetical protein